MENLDYWPFVAVGRKERLEAWVEAFHFAHCKVASFGRNMNYTYSQDRPDYVVDLYLSRMAVLDRDVFFCGFRLQIFCLAFSRVFFLVSGKVVLQN